MMEIEAEIIIIQRLYRLSVSPKNKMIWTAGF
jgi:hypothetical protein